MTSSGTKALTLTGKIDEQRAQQTVEQADAPEGATILTPVKPQIAEVLAPTPGEHSLTLLLTLREMAAIAASMQTAVHSGWVRQPSDLNTINSVLRKFHDAKAQYVKENR